MSEDSKSHFSSIGATQRADAIGSAVQGLSYTKNIYEVGSALKETLNRTKNISNSKEFLRIGQAAESLRSNIFQQLVNPHSELSKTLRTVNELKSMLHQATSQRDSRLNELLRSIGRVETAWSANSPKLISSLVKNHYELYGLISSGQITAEQISVGLEDAISSIETVDILEEMKPGEEASSAESEIVTAFLNAGSLKGVSSKTLKFFIALMLLWTWSVTNFNQNIELQKNVGKMFVSAKTPAEARALARNVPRGVDKEKLSGFRVLTGDRVHLREGPSQKYPSTKLLPVGTLLQILDSSERSWLLVSVVEDGEVYEGWVLRGYTKPIR